MQPRVTRARFVLHLLAAFGVADAACAHGAVAPPSVDDGAMTTINCEARRRCVITDFRTGTQTMLVVEGRNNEVEVATESRSAWNKLSARAQAMVRDVIVGMPLRPSDGNLWQVVHYVQAIGAIDCESVLWAAQPGAEGFVSYSWFVDDNGKMLDPKLERVDALDLRGTRVRECLDDFILRFPGAWPIKLRQQRVYGTFRFEKRQPMTID